MATAVGSRLVGEDHCRRQLRGRRVESEEVEGRAFQPLKEEKAKAKQSFVSSMLKSNSFA